MKKILYIITQSEFGGAQRYIFDLAVNLKNEFQIIVAAGGNPNGELFSKLKSQNIKSIFLKNLKRNINPIRDILAFFELRKLIKKERPNIIHLNSSKAGILGSLAIPKNIRPQPKIIYTVHGWVFNEPIIWLKRKMYLFLEKFTAKFKRKIICVSSFDCQTAINNKFPTNKLVVIHNGINFNNLNFLPQKEARQKLLDKINASYKLKTSSPKIIGTIANLYSTKGIKYLVEAAQLLNEKYKISNIIFIVIGEGQERQRLEKLIKECGLEQMFFLVGHIPDAHQYLKAFDIFALSSIKEGFPYVILEAIAANCPVIAASVGGVPEIICDKKTGFLVKSKNSQDLAEKIRSFLENQTNVEECLNQAEKKAKQKFSLKKMIEKTKEVYFM